MADWLRTHQYISFDHYRHFGSGQLIIDHKMIAYRICWLLGVVAIATTTLYETKTILVSLAKQSPHVRAAYSGYLWGFFFRIAAYVAVVAVDTNQQNDIA